MSEPNKVDGAKSLFAIAYADAPDGAVDLSKKPLIFREDFIGLFEDAQEAVNDSGGVAVVYELKRVTVLRRRESAHAHSIPNIAAPT